MSIPSIEEAKRWGLGMKKISKLDWLVYRIFFKRWNKIFMERPEMADKFACHILMWGIKAKEKAKKEKE